MNNYCEGPTVKDKEERRRNTYVFQVFLTQYFTVRTSKKNSGVSLWSNKKKGSE